MCFFGTQFAPALDYLVTKKSTATEEQHSLQASFNCQRVKRLFFLCATATEHCDVCSLADSDAGNAVFVFAGIIK